MLKTRIFPALVAAALIAPGAAFAAGGKTVIHDPAFSFEGPFGTFDRLQLQRGLQVFQEVCASCHGMKFVSFRSLGEQGGPELPDEQIKALAALYEIPAEVGEPFIDTDGERQEAAEYGDMRQGKATDKFPPVTSQNAPDLSLMAKARAGFHGPAGLLINQLRKGIGGPEYIYSLMTGYVDTPECAGDADIDGWYNEAFAPGGYPEECKIFDEDGVEIGRKAPGSWISMPPPLSEDLVEYTVYAAAGDGDHGGDTGKALEAPAPTVEQMSEDVSAFLMWTAEPKMVERKDAGLRNLLMIIILAVLLYYTNKKLWAPVKRKEA
ncbi:MAG: cytochrome c1 [Paracoccaceae bacterium]